MEVQNTKKLKKKRTEMKDAKNEDKIWKLYKNLKMTALNKD